MSYRLLSEELTGVAWALALVAVCAVAGVLAVGLGVVFSAALIAAGAPFHEATNDWGQLAGIFVVVVLWVWIFERFLGGA